MRSALDMECANLDVGKCVFVRRPRAGRASVGIDGENVLSDSSGKNFKGSL